MCRVWCSMYGVRCMVCRDQWRKRGAAYGQRCCLLQDIPVWTVHLLSCTSCALSFPAAGSETPLVCVPSSTAMVVVKGQRCEKDRAMGEGA